MRNRDFIRLVDTIIQRSTDRYICDKLENIRSYAARCCISYSDMNYVNELARKFEIVHNIECEAAQTSPSNNEGVSKHDKNIIAQLRRKLLLADQRIFELEDIIKDINHKSVNNHDTSLGADAVAEIRKAFAKMCHPDIVKCEGIEKSIRTEIFKEFWEELKRIELSHKK